MHVQSNDPPVQLSWNGSVARLLLNRPARGNALSAEMVAAIDSALDACEQRPATLVVIEGAGAHFCTGFDLSSVADETDDSLLARFTRVELLLQRVARMGCATVAVARGRAMGAGADLFAACSHRLIDGNAGFAFPGARSYGLVLGTRRLAVRVGSQTALEWTSSGRLVNAKEAMAAGLASAQLEGDAALPERLEALHRDAPSGGVGPLLRALEGDASADDARDLAALVRSAARPGLQARIGACLALQSRTAGR